MNGTFKLCDFHLPTSTESISKCFPVQQKGAYISKMNNQEALENLETNERCIKCQVFLRKYGGYKKTLKNMYDVQTVQTYTTAVVTIGSRLCEKCRKYIWSKERKREENISANLTSCHKNGLDDIDTVACLRNEPMSMSDSDHEEFAVNNSSTGGEVAFLRHEEHKTETIVIDMPFKRIAATHKYCSICNHATFPLKVIPFEARLRCFITTRIFIPPLNRCCAGHLIKHRFYEAELMNLRIISNNSHIEVTELSKFMEHLCVNVDSSILDRIGDFSMPEERVMAFTGFSWEQILKIRDMLVSLRNTETRNTTQALVTFLFKMRTGNSNSVIASILELQSDQQVSRFCNAVLNSFENDVLPLHFGLQAYSRDYLLTQTSPMARTLQDLSGQLAIICDGTYLRHQKSTNNVYQRKSYSGQKKVPLCKPFTICTTNGFIVDMLGPFYATQNDAQILRQILMEPTGLSELLHPNDVFFVDRGFRDVQQFLTDRGYRVLMPSLKGKKKQLGAKEANESRLVTKIRWVVESIHGILGNKFALLHHQFDNKLLPKAKSFCKIASFLQNTFGSRLNSDEGAVEEIVNRIKATNRDDNPFAVEIEASRWHRRKSPFLKLTSNEILDFPELTVSELTVFFTGTYQLKQSISYLAEILDETGVLSVLYLKEKCMPDIILRLEVPSRHISKKVYKCFLKYKPNINSITGILGYACDCANGLRTIGTCSHLAAVIYFLSHARYLDKIIRPAEHLLTLFQCDSAIPIINSDSDDD